MRLAFVQMPLRSYLGRAALAAVVAAVVTWVSAPEWRVPQHNVLGRDAGGIVSVVDMVEVTVTHADNLTVHCRPEHTQRHVTVRGTAHSMGGQTMFPGALQYDMSRFNKVVSIGDDIYFDLRPVIVVEAGMTWHQLIEHIQPLGMTPLAMQSTADFSIGGSISVNAHGITTTFSVADSINKLTIMLPNCTMATCEPGDALCALAVGGYGAAGIIVHAHLHVRREVPYDWLSMHTYSVPVFWQQFVASFDGPAFEELHYGRLDLATLDQITYVKANPVWPAHPPETLPRLPQANGVGRGIVAVLTHRVVAWMADHMWWPMMRHVRNGMEASLTELLLGGTPTPNEVLTVDLSAITRDAEPGGMTYILQEYFLPVRAAGRWLDALIALLKTHGDLMNKLLNVSIRRIKHGSQPRSYLDYTKKETQMVAFVLLYRTQATPNQDVLSTAHDMLASDAVACGGSFYLPYLPHYHRELVQRAYPKLAEFCLARSTLDPALRFTNVLTERLCAP